MSTFIEGWRIILRLLWSILKRLGEWLWEILEQARDGGQERGPRRYRDACCLTLPANIRARPDPFVYSQEWLRSRGLAITWDNPDFRLIDVDTGIAAPRFGLKPNHDYDVEVTIHNNSLMAAIHTKVLFQVRRFGAGTSLVSDLGSVIVDVPSAGTAVARQRWHTPASGGHNCLLAIITHPDDANPLNNTGQHNTDVALPASPTRKLSFQVGNFGIAMQRFRFEIDAYRIPDDVRCARSYAERQGAEYLRLLQRVHDPRRFPVPQYLQARLSTEEIDIAPGQEPEVALEVTPPAPSQGTHLVNVHVLVGDVLIGGVTAYIEEGH